MMKKGKGYPEHEKDTSKGFGNPFKQDVWGPHDMRSSLNEWDKDSYEMPSPKKSTRKASL
mgnify:FL=1|jgi:hypothetical protein|tara:strand:+ start:556 stop:735 length:180 start_codon:yes stop_codon:yes gene_type:complete